jgi:hypothetical protein
LSAKCFLEDAARGSGAASRAAASATRGLRVADGAHASPRGRGLLARRRQLPRQPQVDQAQQVQQQPRRHLHLQRQLEQQQLQQQLQHQARAGGQRRPGPEPGPARGPWARYCELLERRPWATNAATGLALGLAGDAFCQLTMEGVAPAEYDVPRTLVFSGFNTIYSSTVSVRVYSLYTTVLPARVLASPWRFGAASSLLDNLVHSPAIYLPAYYAWKGALGGQSVAEAAQTYRDQFVPVMRSLLVVWVPVQFCTFCFVPAPQRVAATLAANLVWNSLLSFQSHAPELGAAPLATA